MDREERAAWRGAQKRQVERQMAELQAEEKKRADKIHAEEKREDQIQIAPIEAAKELALKEQEPKAQ